MFDTPVVNKVIESDSARYRVASRLAPHNVYAIITTSEVCGDSRSNISRYERTLKKKKSCKS